MAFRGRVDTVYNPIVINCTQHYDTDPPVIENLRLPAVLSGANVAIRVTYPPITSSVRRSVIIRNVIIEPGITGWVGAIELVNCWQAVIENVNIYAGPHDNLATGGGLVNAIVLDGQTMDTRIAGLRVAHAVTGVLIKGESEGPAITDARILGVTHGIAALTDQGEAGLWVSDSHIAASRVCVLLKNRPQAFLHDNLLYEHPWRSTGTFDPVLLLGGCPDLVQVNNTIKRLSEQ